MVLAALMCFTSAATLAVSHSHGRTQTQSVARHCDTCDLHAAFTALAVVLSIALQESVKTEVDPVEGNFRYTHESLLAIVIRPPPVFREA